MVVLSLDPSAAGNIDIDNKWICHLINLQLVNEPTFTSLYDTLNALHTHKDHNLSILLLSHSHSFLHFNVSNAHSFNKSFN